MNLFHLKIPAGYKAMTDNTGRPWQEKNLGGYVTSISVKNFEFALF